MRGADHDIRYPWKEIPGSSHQVLLEKILALGEGLRVLDLGFGAGHLARRIRPWCKFLAGIELDPEAAREGARYFDLPIEGDLLEALETPLGGPFDVIVAGDILEHLPQPAQILQALLPLLEPRGLFLASLPNVANITVRLSLLLGRFEYGRRGILDEGHLRFYTARSARRLLEDNGLRVAGLTATPMPIELALPALGRDPWAPLVRGSASLAAEVWPSLFAYQFVFEATPS